MGKIPRELLVGVITSLIVTLGIIFLPQLYERIFGSRIPTAVYDVRRRSIGDVGYDIISIENKSKVVVTIEKAYFRFQNPVATWAAELRIQLTPHSKTETLVLSAKKQNSGLSRKEFQMKCPRKLPLRSSIVAIFVTNGPNIIQVANDWLTMKAPQFNKSGDVEYVPVKIQSKLEYDNERTQLWTKILKWSAILVFVLTIIIGGIYLARRKKGKGASPSTPLSTEALKQWYRRILRGFASVME